MNIECLIDLLADTSKRTEKISLLKEYDSELTRDVFRLTCDPFVMFNINKIPKPRLNGTRSVEDAFGCFEQLAVELSSRQVTGNEARERVKVFLETCTPKAQDIFIKILKKDLKCGVNISTVNKAFGKGTIETFDVQLANTYDPNKSYDVKGWWASRKLDGIRGFYKDGVLLTRSGKQIIGFDHIIEELKSLCEEYGVEFVDGEMYSEQLPFQKIQGYVVRNKNFTEEDKKKIKFNVFVVGTDVNRTKYMIDLMNAIEWSNYEHLTPLEYEWVDNNHQAIDTVCKKFVHQGYEGAMLRSQYVAYVPKRSDDLLKVKLFLESDFKVVGFLEGTGKHEGRLGAFEVEGKIGDKDIVANVGSGLNDEDRELYWRERDDLVGKLIEVKYQNITDKPSPDGTYSIRFPIFMKFKLDR